MGGCTAAGARTGHTLWGDLSKSPMDKVCVCVYMCGWVVECVCGWVVECVCGWLSVCVGGWLSVCVGGWLSVCVWVSR